MPKCVPQLFLGSLPESLSKDLFERRKSTGSGSSKSSPGESRYIMRKRPHFQLTYVAQKRLPYWPIIGHFRVPKTPTFKMRPSAQLFLWKWVLFAWEWKIFSISKGEHLTSFWYRGPRELGIGLLVNYHSLCLITVPEAFAEVSSAQFLLVSKSGEFIKVTKKRLLT